MQKFKICYYFLFKDPYGVVFYFEVLKRNIDILLGKIYSNTFLRNISIIDWNSSKFTHRKSCTDISYT